MFITKQATKNTLIVLILILLICIGFLTKSFTFQTTSITNNNNASTTGLAEESVRKARLNLSFPIKYGLITWSDMTAEGSAIRYSYTIPQDSGKDFSIDYLKGFIPKSICQNKYSRNLLDQGVSMEYSYVVENSTQTYFLSFTKVDCSN